MLNKQRAEEGQQKTALDALTKKNAELSTPPQPRRKNMMFQSLL
ncbi:MAG: hypothetical protein ACLR17_05060 [Enterobacteriaceae bacterium]